jgi:D-alanine--poly(phosphoribitol) ligase subunit 2
MTQEERTLDIVRKIAKKNVTPDPDESLFDSGYLDSFALPDMVSALEQEFGIEVPDSDLNPRKFATLNRISEYLNSRL